MSDLKYKLAFEDLCRYSDLGELVNQPVPISGGLLHKMYSVETTTGKYAVKLLNPNIMARSKAMQNYINSEKISSFLSTKIPALSAENKDENMVPSIDGQFYLVFRWIEGSSLTQEEIDVRHCEKVGGILADIHQTDFSVLELNRGRTDNVPLINWEFYLQKGKEEDAEWAGLLLENIDNLKGWNSSAAAAAECLFSNMIISHRDLDPKNVLWNHFNPVVIDWESAGFIHPLQDLIETAIYWSIVESGEIDRQKFFSFLSGYKMKCGELDADWRTAMATGFSGRLGWLEYSLKRSLWIECTDEEEQKIGTAQVTGTIHELRNYAEQIPNLLRWISK